MKFTFASPSLEIKAPVLNDKTVGFQVYRRLAEVPVDLILPFLYDPLRKDPPIHNSTLSTLKTFILSLL